MRKIVWYRIMQAVTGRSLLALLCPQRLAQDRHGKHGLVHRSFPQSPRKANRFSSSLSPTHTLFLSPWGISPRERGKVCWARVPLVRRGVKPGAKSPGPLVPPYLPYLTPRTGANGAAGRPRGEGMGDGDEAAFARVAATRHSRLRGTGLLGLGQEQVQVCTARISLSQAFCNRFPFPSVSAGEGQ